MTDALTLQDRLRGSWTGESTLWLEPNDPGRRSASTLVASERANGKFVEVAYTWSFEDRPQTGSLLIGWDAKAERWQAAWVDSWHMGSVMMSCVGTDAGAIDVRGEYEAGDGGPNWGWRIGIEIGERELILRMWNIVPEGIEYPAGEVPAVEARYKPA